MYESSKTGVQVPPLKANRHNALMERFWMFFWLIWCNGRTWILHHKVIEFWNKVIEFWKWWPWILEAYHLTHDLKNLEQLKDAWAWFQDYFTAIRPHLRPKTSRTAERCVSMISRLFHRHIGSHSWTKTSGTAERCVSMISRLFQSHMTSWLKRWLFSRIHSQ